MINYNKNNRLDNSKNSLSLENEVEQAVKTVRKYERGKILFTPIGRDETDKINYFNDYGRTKYLAEEKYRDWLKKDSSNCAVIIRPTVIFG